PTGPSAGGTIVLNADRSLLDAPPTTFAGADTFQYKLQNAAGSSTATVTITVVAPPIAVADAYQAGLNVTLNVAAGPGVLTNDTLNSGTIVSYGATTGNEQPLID